MPKLGTCSYCNEKKLVRSYKGKPYCEKHLTQLKRHGVLFEMTRFTPNDVVKHSSYFELVLRDYNQIEVGRAKVSMKHLERVTKHKWRLIKGYVVSTISRKNVFLHRFILNESNPNIKVDHKHHNPLDNRDFNLRRCTQRQNAMNTSKKACNTSGTIGVTYDSTRGKWRAQIRINGVVTNLGRRESKEEAIRLRLKAEREHFGEFAPQAIKRRLIRC